ncbi:hypothetical protein THIARS_50481 [Thiomonas delicata]|uniref:Uncharacterized protein n=1 Tax=Thiomonas delicata TaxID=364030 RepID=A0A238D1V3_THIDL|nr:hypothetical protein THIARS_50481 [Thiomonas delicata]
MFRRGLGRSGFRLPDLADGNALQTTSAPVPEIDQATGEEHRGEHRGEDAQHVNDGKAAYRARTEDEQRQARDQRGDVGVENRGPGALVAGGDGRLGRGAVAQLLTHALVDQHVRVDGHAQRQRHGGDAGQGERGLQHRQQRHQQQQIHRQGNGGKRAEQHVVDAHEDDDGDETPGHRVKALRDVLLAQARADGAFLDDLHRRRQRSGAQQQGDIVGFRHGHVARDLHAAAGDFATHHRRGHDLGAVAVDQHHRNTLADVGAGDVAENARPSRIEREKDGGFVVLRVETSLRIGEIFAGEQHVLLHHQGIARAVIQLLVAGRHRTAARQRRLGFRAVVHQAHLQRRRAPQDVLGARRVLNARKLDHDAIAALLLDDGLGHAEFVDAVVQGGDVLLDRIVLGLLDGLRTELDADGTSGRRCGIGDDGISRDLLDDRLRRLEHLGIAEIDLDLVAHPMQFAVAHVLVAQRCFQFARDRIQFFLDGGLHVDLQQEMHATAQIETQVHGHRMQGGEPSRRQAQQIDGDHVVRVVTVGIERVREYVARLELHFGAGKTVVQRRAADEAAHGRLQPRSFQRLQALGQQGLIGQIASRVRRTDLHGGRLAEEIRQCIHKPHHQHDGHDEVFPQRVTVHGGLRRRRPAGGFCGGERRVRAPSRLGWTRNSGALDGAFGQHHAHRRALHLHFELVCDFQLDIVVPDLGDAAHEAAGGHHLVAFGQGLDHGLDFLLAPHLGADHHEVEDDEHHHDGQQAHQRGLGTGLGGSRLGVREGDQIHGVDPFKGLKEWMRKTSHKPALSQIWVSIQPRCPTWPCADMLNQVTADSLSSTKPALLRRHAPVQRQPAVGSNLARNLTVRQHPTPPPRAV